MMLLDSDAATPNSEVDPVHLFVQLHYFIVQFGYDKLFLMTALIVFNTY